MGAPKSFKCLGVLWVLVQPCMGGTLWIEVLTLNEAFYTSTGRKEGNVLFNDALNIFYLQLYGVRYMVKDQPIAREETCHIGYSIQLAARFFYMHHPTDRITHSTVFVTPVVEH